MIVKRATLEDLEKLAVVRCYNRVGQADSRHTHV